MPRSVSSTTPTKKGAWRISKIGAVNFSINSVSKGNLGITTLWTGSRLFMAVSQGLWSRNRRLFMTWITRGGGRSNCRHCTMGPRTSWTRKGCSRPWSGGSKKKVMADLDKMILRVDATNQVTKKMNEKQKMVPRSEVDRQVISSHCQVCDCLPKSSQSPGQPPDLRIQPKSSIQLSIA